MSEFKFTKGKWTSFKPQDGNGFVYVNNEYLTTGTIATCYGDGEEPQANALLISKAPDLLEELDKARQIIRSLKLSMLGHPDCTYNSEFDDLTTKAQQYEDEIEKLIKGATEL
jgi:hypothetical protein